MKTIWGKLLFIFFVFTLSVQSVLASNINGDKIEKQYIYTIVFALLFIIALIAYLSQKRRVDKQQFEIKQVKALDRERAKISTDLQDKLSGKLTSIATQIDTLLHQTEKAEHLQALEKIKNLSLETNHVMNETVWTIVQEDIDLNSLYEKVNIYAERALSSSPIQWAVKKDEKEKILSPNEAFNLFRIIQEAINNTIYYSDCKHLLIKISNNSIEIKDDGKGFDLLNVKQGYGLKNMKERTQHINGHIDIQTSENKGTRIVVHF